MDENLAANDRDIATPEGAANMGESAPLPAAAATAEPLAAPDAPAADAGAGRELTRRVAQRIKEERQKAQSELMNELFGSEEACAAYRAGRERQEMDSADLREAAIYAELALATDPDLGEHYLALADEVKELAQTYGTDVESAFLVLLSRELPRLLREGREQAEQDLLAKLAANSALPGSLSAPEAAPTGLSSLSDAEFASLVQRIKLGQ